MVPREGVTQSYSHSVTQSHSHTVIRIILSLEPGVTKRLTWTTLMTAMSDNGNVARIRRQEPNMRMRDTIPGTWIPKINFA